MEASSKFKAEPRSCFQEALPWHIDAQPQQIQVELVEGDTEAGVGVDSLMEGRACSALVGRVVAREKNRVEGRHLGEGRLGRE